MKKSIKVLMVISGLLAGALAYPAPQVVNIAVFNYAADNEKIQNDWATHEAPAIAHALGNNAQIRIHVLNDTGSPSGDIAYVPSKDISEWKANGYETLLWAAWPDQTATLKPEMRDVLVSKNRLSLADLEGKKIAAVGSMESGPLKALKEKSTAQVTYVPFPTYASALVALNAGEVDTIPAVDFRANQWLKEYPALTIRPFATHDAPVLMVKSGVFSQVKLDKMRSALMNRTHHAGVAYLSDK